MADDPRKVEVTVDGCALWLIAFALMSLTAAIYAIADAIKALHQ